MLFASLVATVSLRAVSATSGELSFTEGVGAVNDTIYIVREGETEEVLAITLQLSELRTTEGKAGIVTAIMLWTRHWYGVTQLPIKYYRIFTPIILFYSTMECAWLQAFSMLNNCRFSILTYATK